MFEYIHLEEESKGDFAFEVHADTLEELLKGAGLATMSVMVNLDSLRNDLEYEIKLASPDLTLLLFDFLSELVYLKDAESLLFNDFEIKIRKNRENSQTNNPYNLICVAKGAHINWEKDELLTDVKAVTMHTMVIEQRENRWYCHTILDL